MGADIIFSCQHDEEAQPYSCHLQALPTASAAAISIFLRAPPSEASSKRAPTDGSWENHSFVEHIAPKAYADCWSAYRSTLAEP
jgi:hypothetical protein